MGKWIVVRLLAETPTAGSDFTTYLQGLTISAFDLSTADSRVGTKLGEATFVAPPNPAQPWVPASGSRIVQHFTAPPLPFSPTAEAVATAVIEITALPAGYKEYARADVRLEITRGGTPVPHRTLYYDVVVQPHPVPAASAFPGIGSADVALYLRLRSPSASAAIDIGPDGAPPNFKALRDAVEAVLAADQQSSPPATLGSLTPEQARHIAYELLWERQDALPRPPGSGVPFFDDLGALYTNPPNDGALTNSAEQNRQQFEGNLTSHYATLDAKVDRLAGFVFGLSAAVACEQRALATTKAFFEFPVNPSVPNPLATLKLANVLLVDGTGGGGPLVPAFAVPAEYFYVLGAHLPMQVSAEQRFKSATRDDQERLLPLLTSAWDDGTIDPKPTVNPAQAVRRITALRPASDTSATLCRLDAAVSPLVNDWLAFPSLGTWRDYRPGDDAVEFWTPEALAQPQPYLRLVLAALTLGYQPLIDAVIALPVISVSALAALTGTQWTGLFVVKAATSASVTTGTVLPFATAAEIAAVVPAMAVSGVAIAAGASVVSKGPTTVTISLPVIGSVPQGATISFTNPTLLPPFTAPGTFEARLSAFLRYIEKFFALTFGAAPLPVPGSGAQTFLDLPQIDLITAFVNAYVPLVGGAFTFGAGGLDDAKVVTAIQSIAVLANDPAARAWLDQRVHIINDLCRLAGVVSGPTIPTVPTIAFSIVEALYVRGFTSAADIQALAASDFTAALRGTVAHSHAAAIYAAAGASGPAPIPPSGPASPVNPGSLVDCIPPCWLSPLGPIAYLHEVLALAESATCAAPLEPVNGAGTIAEALTSRRGPLGLLAANAANAETPLPRIDLVNENLEHLAATLPGTLTGVVHDTTEAPAALRAAMPEHSSPALVLADSAAYDKLRVDFSSPRLPYSQPHDVTRTYLDHLRTCRYETMRVAREHITELALDPSLSAPTFQSHLWRYPVRIEAAIEYLGIAPDEYELLFVQDIVGAPSPGHLVLHELYGFTEPTHGGRDWIDTVLLLPEFLRRTGLDYCELVELQRARCFEFVALERGERGHNRDLPDCPPCCPEHVEIRFVEPGDTAQTLKQLAVFVRLWRKLQRVCGARYSFTELCDICKVLQLFVDGSVNPDFIRQLAAFQILRDDLQVRLTDGSEPATGVTGADRTHVLALWVGPSSSHWEWAIGHLLERIHRVAERRKVHDRPPHFIKLLAQNLEPLSLVAGFDPTHASDTWHARPTNTLRFVEVLVKVHASKFGIGELLYLFTADEHLDGDDPFPLQDPNESVDDPLELPEDSPHSLWVLRDRLLAAEVDDDDARAWTWAKIERALRRDFGYEATAVDYLESLGKHYFPSILEHAGIDVASTERQYRVTLATTSPDMWNVPPDGPFHYDVAKKQLWLELPLRDAAVFDKLEHVRALTAAERFAVQDLYALPRVDLAPFACLFPSFAAAERHLIEADEHARWEWFRRQFALAHKRCTIIARHLAHHVAAVSDHEAEGVQAAAWLILRRLLADENRALTTWEVDSGDRPDVLWNPRPAGGGFAALLGLVGTGLLGEVRRGDTTCVWRETRGPLAAFDRDQNEKNSPAPTIVPAMDLTLTPEQLRFVELRNGFAITAHHGRELGGAEGFSVTWSGALLVECEGRYAFEVPDEVCHEHARWRVTLKRGQKVWVMVARNWHGEHRKIESSLALKRGAYEIVVELVEPPPPFAELDDLRPQRTGFALHYKGPDTKDELVVVPVSRLYRDLKDDTLAHEVELSSDAAPARSLALRYTSTLRDIRRTYQRAFKALLFAHRFELSAKDVAPYHQSELGYMLDHGALFAGVSYYRNPTFTRHTANFDFNFLPLRDPYRSPRATQDNRVQPSRKRTQALFDWWERIYDYTRMRHDRRDAVERPVWLLFEEAAEVQPDNPAHLLRHLDVDLRAANATLGYFTTQTAPVKKLSAADLMDDRWAVRVWHASEWCHDVVKNFSVRDMRIARPDLWASDDPAKLVPGESETGYANLTQLVIDGCIAIEAPPRHDDLARLTDGLRERARCALLAFLCGMDRVPLPWGGHATAPKHLSGLLLLDVEAGLRERASRIEEATSATQIFVQRARLGLEPSWNLTPAFMQVWTSQFERYDVWEKCKCRTLYRENYIEWDDLRSARDIEAFQFLEEELRRSTLTIAAPGGFEYWPSTLPPVHPKLALLQQREASTVRLLAPARDGLGILGVPERDARPAWLAPSPEVVRTEPQPDPEPEPGGPILAIANPGLRDGEELPLWMKAAIRLGAKFIRVAAAGIPPAVARFEPSERGVATACCDVCDREHAPHADEYYFWLVSGEAYETQEQDAYYDATLQVSARWHDPEALPALLDWTSARTARLAWCRVHNGELQQVRRSDESVRLLPESIPDLAYVGRTGDSLTFIVTGGVQPVGHAGTDTPGFRYELALDLAIALPTLATLVPANNPYPAGLPSYPFFAYAEPGARLFPSSLFSTSIAVANVLRCHSRFEAALKWYRLAYDPLASDNTWIDCNPTRGPDDSTGTNVPSRAAIVDTCCDSTNVGGDVLRDRAILLQYVETLVAWSRALHRRSSRESAQLMRLILDTAASILGPCPRVLENHVSGRSQTVASFVPANPPLNPRLMQLYRDVEDGLVQVHVDQSAARLLSSNTDCAPPYSGQHPCDCGSSGHHACCPNSEPCCADDLSCSGHSPYRFTYVLQKARDAVARVREMGNALVSAFERGDAEYLASMRARQDTELADLTIQVRKEQWRDADWQLKALRKTKEVSQTNRRYFKRLIDLGLNFGELNYESNMNTAIGFYTAAIPSEAVGEALRLIPDLFVGFPSSQTWLPLGTKLGEMFQTIARITNELGGISSSNANLDLTQAGWQRRAEEWAHQVEVLDVEIEQIELQILAAERRRDQALQELNIQQRTLESSREAFDFLRDKFTNHELYLFLQRETSALYTQFYEIALQLSREAERALDFELARGRRQFLPCDGWNTLHEGLLAGEKLDLALQRIDAEYVSSNHREYELTKHISLATSFPQQLLQLKLTGSCEVEIPEWMFDQDHAGHYMRRIRSVSLTIPAVTGPYTGVHCRLTLLRSSTRIAPSLACPKSECCAKRPRNACGCRHDPAEHYTPCARDHRHVKHYGASEAIATSTGRNDAGLFELDFRDERRLPFEFRGAVSCWRLELPPENNYFDLDSLTDVIVQMNYTAREGGEPLRTAAAHAARKNLPGNGWIYLDLEKELPDAWELLRRASARGDRHASIAIPLTRKLFPFLPGDPPLTVSHLGVLFDVDDHGPGCPELDGCPCSHHDVRAKRLVRVEVDGVRQQGDDDCEVEIACVRSESWQGLYHGASSIKTRTVQRRREHQSLKLKLGRDLCELRRAFVLLRYEVDAECCPTTRRHDAP